jgi:hypothetical protein
MSIERDGECLRLVGNCGVEDAEGLLAHLATGANRADVGGCETMHAAIFQLLMASGMEIAGDPPEFLARWGLLAAPMPAPGGANIS